MRSNSKGSIEAKNVPHVYLNGNKDSQRIERLIVESGIEVKIFNGSSRSIHLPAIVAEGKVLRRIGEMEEFLEKRRITFKSTYRGSSD